MHTLWHAVLLKAYSVMCVGEAEHLRVLVSIISDFLHMRHSMFGSHMRACTGCAALMYEAAFSMGSCYLAHMYAWEANTITWRRNGTGDNRSSSSSSQITNCRKIECDRGQRAMRGLSSSRPRRTLPIRGLHSPRWRLLTGDNSVQGC